MASKMATVSTLSTLLCYYDGYILSILSILITILMLYFNAIIIMNDLQFDILVAILDTTENESMVIFFKNHSLL